MAKIGFVGFGEVNTPVDVIIRKCKAAEDALKAEGLDLVSVYPVADDYEETQVKAAVEDLQKQGAVRFVFDMRGNTGGLLTSVVEVLDYLLPEGVIIRITDSEATSRRRTPTHPK